MKKIGQERWEQIILPALCNFETMTWHEIKAASGGKGVGRGTKSHPIPIEQLSKEAQKRLEELQQDDIEELFSLRIAGKIRVFGIRDRNILKIIWFDF